jgi:hypothetical protein
MALTTKTAALVIGIVFLLVGILGFVPNPLVSQTGLFQVNVTHNLVHLVSGAAILAGAYTNFGAGLTLKVFGAIYALVALLGFFTVSSGGLMLGLVLVNHADHWLHALLAVVILGAGFLLPDDTPTTVRA